MSRIFGVHCSKKSAFSGVKTDCDKDSFVSVRVAREVLKDINPFTTSEKDLYAKVEEVFSSLEVKRDFEFQNKALLEDIKAKLWRYILWEQNVNSGTLLLFNQCVDIKLFGDRKIPVTYLIDRGEYLEAMAFVWSKVAAKTAIKDFNSGKEEAEKGLELWFAGKILAKEIKATKPVIASIIHLRGYSEKATDKVTPTSFETHTGDNVQSVNFETVKGSLKMALKHLHLEKGQIEKGVEASPSSCYGCDFEDICNLSLIPRKGNLRKDFTSKETESAGAKAATHFKPNRSQLDIIKKRKGIFKVDACAGAGKTTVISFRVLEMLAEGVDPKEIMMVTYTNKGAAEMRQKLESLNNALMGGLLNLKGITISTSNSWCQALVDKHYDKLGYTEKPRLIEDLDDREIVAELLERGPVLPLRLANPFENKRYQEGAVVELITIFKALKANGCASVSDILKVYPEWTDKNSLFKGLEGVVFAYFEEYNDTLLKKNIITYKDQTRFALELEKMGCFKDLGYKHIIIDEAQDNTKVEHELIEKIIANVHPESVIFVGDACQSIYGFINASPELFRDLPFRYPELEELTLDNNFRSGEAVINLANQVIERDSDSLSRMNIKGNISKSGKVSLFSYRGKEEEDNIKTVVASTLDKWKSEGYSYNDMAILCRNNSSIKKVTKILQELNAPFVIQTKEIIRDNPYVKVIFGLNSFLKNGNEVGLALYAKYLGLDLHDFDTVRKLGADTILDVLGEGDTLKEEEKKAKYFDILSKIADNDFLAAEFVEKVKNHSKGTLNDIISWIYKYDKYQIKDEVETSVLDEGISIYTVHGSKGLEFPCEMLFLDFFSDYKKGSKAFAEEKRLLYVGITRARDNLLVVYKKSQSWIFDLLEEDPSPFD